jgi:hypothetical protein
MKIVINDTYGGFGLSDAAIELYAEFAGLQLVSEVDRFGFTNYYRDSIHDDNYFCYRSIARDCVHLVAVVETLGSEAASGKYANLKVVEIPHGVQWHIEEYDGNEWIAENHRTWE